MTKEGYGKPDLRRFAPARESVPGKGAAIMRAANDS